MSGSWQDARRILCVRLDSIGDVLMTTPAIRAVKEGGARVTLLTSPAGAGVARLVPEIDEVIGYEAPWMKAGAPHGVENDLAMIARLRAQRFDAAIVFTVYSQNPLPAAMLAYLAGIPLCLAHCRERGYRLLSDAVPETEPEAGVRHEVRRQLDLVATLGWRPSSERLSLTPPPAAYAAVDAMLGEAVRGRSWAVLHPGASAPSRRYPPALYAEAVRLLHGEGWEFVATGDAGEAALVAEIAARSGVPLADWSGRLSLAELAALIDRAPLLLTNNTGPAHIAAAMQTPVVDLYALTNPQHTPWAVPSRVLSHDVPCRWCYRSVCPEGHHRCLLGVAPETVAAAALALAHETAPVPA